MLRTSVTCRPDPRYDLIRNIRSHEDTLGLLVIEMIRYYCSEYPIDLHELGTDWQHCKRVRQISCNSCLNIVILLRSQARNWNHAGHHEVRTIIHGQAVSGFFRTYRKLDNAAMTRPRTRTSTYLSTSSVFVISILGR